MKKYFKIFPIFVLSMNVFAAMSDPSGGCAGDNIGDTEHARSITLNWVSEEDFERLRNGGFSDVCDLTLNLDTDEANEFLSFVDCDSMPNLKLLELKGWNNSLEKGALLDDDGKNPIGKTEDILRGAISCGAFSNLCSLIYDDYSSTSTGVSQEFEEASVPSLKRLEVHCGDNLSAYSVSGLEHLDRIDMYCHSKSFNGIMKSILNDMCCARANWQINVASKDSNLGMLESIKSSELFKKLKSYVTLHSSRVTGKSQAELRDPKQKGFSPKELCHAKEKKEYPQKALSLRHAKQEEETSRPVLNIYVD